MMMSIISEVPCSPFSGSAWSMPSAQVLIGEHYRPEQASTRAALARYMAMSIEFWPKSIQTADK